MWTYMNIYIIITIISASLSLHVVTSGWSRSISSLLLYSYCSFLSSCSGSFLSPTTEEGFLSLSDDLTGEADVWETNTANSVSAVEPSCRAVGLNDDSGTGQIFFR